MKLGNLLGFLISILIGLFVFFVGVEVKSEGTPNQIFKVYLNNQILGLLESKEDLLALIDHNQESIKAKYKVEKVYPPTGLEIREEYTFSNDIKTTEEIYELIQDKDPFTIEGYTVTVKYPNDEVVSEGTVTKKETQYINVLKKEDFEEAFKTVIKAFVGSDKYDLYVENNQLEFTGVGSRIESIYWDEIITIKESLIDVNSEIYTSANDVSKYLFFQTTKEQEPYTIKEGDDIESISEAHNLNPDEFLVANPEFTSKNVLLSPGQKVNVGLIKPVVTIVSEVHAVEDIVNKFTTEYVNDPNSYYGTSKVVQNGVNGLTRVTEKILYKNGEIQDLLIAAKDELVPTTNKIISRGTKSYGGGYQYYENKGDWSWPTLSPFVITSKYGPRWGRNHNGLDISGTGFGSPIKAVQSGTVIITAYDGSYGYHTVIDHHNGYFTIYAHLARAAIYKPGAEVKREQVIGYMGNTGFSTGTHLHLGVVRSEEFRYTGFLDPCKSIFRC